MAGISVRALARLAFALSFLAGSGVCGSELPENAEDPSAFSTLIEARDFDARFATVEDLLEHAAGVRVRRFGGLGAHSTASIRGAKAEQVLVVVDGVRVDSSLRGAFDFSSLPLREIERIEVLRGGGSARYGSDALGGVISITTRRPESAEPSADLALVGGSHGTRGGDASLSAYGASGSYTRLSSENDFEFEHEGRGHTRLNADFVDQGALLRGELELGRDSRLEAMLLFHDRDAGQPGNTRDKPLVDIPDDRLSCTSSSEDTSRGLARLGWRTALGRDGGIELAGFHRREGGGLDDPLGACGLVVPLFTGGRSSAGFRESSSGLDLSAVLPELHAGFAWLGLRGSASLRHDGVTSDDSEPQRRTTHSFSLLGDVALFDRRLRLLPSLGFEAASSSQGRARRTSSASFEELSLRDESVWLPGIGAIVELAPGLRAKANLKRAFRRPSFGELFQPDRSYLRGNPWLRSERARNADAGLDLGAARLGPLRDLLVQAVFFRREIDESIEWMFVSNNTIMPINVGPARVRGAELSVSFDVLEIIELAFGHTWTDARFVERGRSSAVYRNPVAPIFPHVPRRAGFARLGFALGPAHLYGEARYESEIGFQVGQAYSSDAALQFDAGLALQASELPGLGFLPRGLSLSLDASNISREPRIDALGQPLPAEALFYLRARIELPR